MRDVEKGQHHLLPIPSPIFHDNSYQANLYLAWVLLSSCASARWYLFDERWTLTNLQWYICALAACN